VFVVVVFMSREWHEEALWRCAVMWLWGCACDVVHAPSSSSVPPGFITKGRREKPFQELCTCIGKQSGIYLQHLRVENLPAIKPHTVGYWKISALSNVWHTCSMYRPRLWLYIFDPLLGDPCLCFLAKVICWSMSFSH
jgi:hypothetical protein